MRHFMAETQSFYQRSTSCARPWSDRSWTTWRHSVGTRWGRTSLFSVIQSWAALHWHILLCSKVHGVKALWPSPCLVSCWLTATWGTTSWASWPSTCGTSATNTDTVRLVSQWVHTHTYTTLAHSNRPACNYLNVWRTQSYLFQKKRPQWLPVPRLRSRSGLWSTSNTRLSSLTWPTWRRRSRGWHCSPAPERRPQQPFENICVHRRRKNASFICGGTVNGFFFFKKALWLLNFTFWHWMFTVSLDQCKRKLNVDTRRLKLYKARISHDSKTFKKIL